jgi:hypothetical protein
MSEPKSSIQSGTTPGRIFYLTCRFRAFYLNLRLAISCIFCGMKTAHCRRIVARSKDSGENDVLLLSDEKARDRVTCGVQWLRRIECGWNHWCYHGRVQCGY